MDAFRPFIRRFPSIYWTVSVHFNPQAQGTQTLREIDVIDPPLHRLGRSGGRVKPYLVSGQIFFEYLKKYFKQEKKFQKNILRILNLFCLILTLLIHRKR